MLIEYVGPRTRQRIYGEYEFSRGTGYVQAMEADAAAELLTEPGDSFRVHPEEPLLRLRGMTPEMVGILALAGIGCLGCLRELKRSQQRRLASELGVGARRVSAWVKTAQATADTAPRELDLFWRQVTVSSPGIR